MARKTTVKSLIQRLTDLYFDLSKKAKRDPRTWQEAAVRAKLARVERIIHRRYGSLYHLTMTNLGDVVVDENGEEQESLGIAFLTKLYGYKTYIQTSFNTRENTHILGDTPFRKNFAGIGYLWNTEIDGFGSGEKSRFITQLFSEYPHQINEYVYICYNYLIFYLLSSDCIKRS